MQKIIQFIKSEIVLAIAFILAIVSMFLVIPDKKYLDYIDFRTLAILFSLMTVMAGFRRLGLFDSVAVSLLSRLKSTRLIMLTLIMLCFIFSMFITNDVALITFVPFAFVIYSRISEQVDGKWLVTTVVTQTVAANLGSMLTPLGNPQNLYLYGQSGYGIGKFLTIMLPYTLISLLLILAYTFISSRRSHTISFNFDNKPAEKNTLKTVLYLLVFLVCLLAVLRIVHYLVAFSVTLVIAAIFDRKTLTKVDYTLLATFVCFFIFIGNMSRIPAFGDFIEKIISGNEVLVSVISSQIISNVPAALLLSGFTSNYSGLIIGTNLGGLGTLIASMASLISYKFIAKEHPDMKGKYFLQFTIVNVVFLVILTGAYYIF